MKQVTLPYVNNLEVNNPDIPIQVSMLCIPDDEKTKAKVKTPVKARPLPRNAGTAAILRRNIKERERVESPPPPITDAVVIVC